MPRFVVLTHNHPDWHWDFMLEEGETLRTWRLAQSPAEPGPTAAEGLAGHRLAYLDYEGPVSGNRGEVRRWDRGVYTVVLETETRLEIVLAGAVLRGKVVLQQQNDQRQNESPAWLYCFTVASTGACTGERTEEIVP